MTQKLLTLPFRLGFGAARTAFDISAKTLDVSTTLARVAIETIRPGHDSGPDTEAPSEPRQDATASQTGGSPEAQSTTSESPESPPKTRRPRESRVNGHSAASPTPPPPPAPPTPITPPDEQPDTPLTREQEVVKTLDDEEELVAEFAEPGAEDGAGAQLDIQEPWEGYARMNAGTIVSRIDQAGAAELALVELYEQTHKKRQSVITAAAKRLRALSPPENTPGAE
ncbi:MAG TPA: hypothetical protein VG405_09005 [Solirubrobacteraceae bacterium]|jgi:hypothetical protein|nr:hypothetical protein [Solirubrobacteraceae bacterium]